MSLRQHIRSSVGEYLRLPSLVVPLFSLLNGIDRFWEPRDVFCLCLVLAKHSEVLHRSGSYRPRYFRLIKDSSSRTYHFPFSSYYSFVLILQKITGEEREEDVSEKVGGRVTLRDVGLPHRKLNASISRRRN